MNPYAMKKDGQPTKRKRRKGDFYATKDEDVTIALVRHYRKLIERHVTHEPACGEGHMSKVLIEQGLDVVSTDLFSRGYGTPWVNFLTIPAEQYACGKFNIITNPPFTHWAEFVMKAHELGAPFIAMFAKQGIWNAKKRLKLYREHPPKAVHPLTWRVDFDGRGRPTMDCCWVVWGDEVPFSNEPFERPVHA